MAVSFDIAWDALMVWEDSHPISGQVIKDAGGLTKYGISQRAFPNVDITNLTMEGAKELGRRYYWVFDNVPFQATATKLFDMGYNLGLGTMCLYLSAVLLVHGDRVPTLTYWSADYDRAIGNHDVDSVLAGLRIQQLEHYIREYKGIHNVPSNTIKRALA